MGTLKGKILEIGSGTGVNLRFYQSEATDIQSYGLFSSISFIIGISKRQMLS